MRPTAEITDPTWQDIQDRDAVIDGFVAALRKVEWAGRTKTAGYGVMESGGNGPLVSCCPECNGINPKDPDRREFRESAHGHRKRCSIRTALAKAGKDTP